MQASHVKFTNIARVYKKPVQESYEGVLRCDGGMDHDEDDLMTFFLSNPELVLFYTSIDEEGPTSDVRS